MLLEEVRDGEGSCGGDGGVHGGGLCRRCSGGAAADEELRKVGEGGGHSEGAGGEVRHLHGQDPPGGGRHDGGDARRARLRGRQQAEDAHQLC